MKNFKLDDYPKIETGFKVPDGYFEELPSKVMRRLENKPRVIALKPRNSWMMAAAAILILALALPTLNRIYEPTVSTDSAAIENYLLRQTGISSYELADELTSEELLELHDFQLDDMQIEEALSQQDVEHYIEY